MTQSACYNIGVTTIQLAKEDPPEDQHDTTSASEAKSIASSEMDTIVTPPPIPLRLAHLVMMPDEILFIRVPT